MATALSVDLRSRVIAAVDGGMSRRRAASRFGVSYSSAIRWVRQARESGAISRQSRRAVPGGTASSTAMRT